MIEGMKFVIKGTKFFHNLGARIFFVRFLFAVPFLLFFSSCQTDMSCRKPNPNELKNIKSILFKDGKLVVLSSPQDVLTWCSAFLSVFEYSEDSLRFLKNIELSGKIAHDIVWIDKRLAVLISSSDRQVIDVVDPEIGEVVSSLSLDLQNMKSISSYGKSILVLPQLDKRIFFAEDIDELINNSKSGRYFVIEYLAKSGAIAEAGGKKYIFIIGEKNSMNAISQDGITQDINISEITNIAQLQQEFISAVSSEVKPSQRLEQLGINVTFNSKMFFRDVFIFIHASSESGDMKGIFVYDVRCLNESIQNCSWFVPITSDKNSSLDNIFVFYPIRYGDNLKIFPFIYSITSDVNDEEKKRQYSFISLLLLNDGKFYFVDKKIVSISQIYELVEYEISEYKEERNSSVSEDEGEYNSGDKGEYNKVSSGKNEYSDKFSDSDGKTSREVRDTYEYEKGISLKIKFVFKENEYDNIRFFEYETNLLLNQ